MPELIDLSLPIERHPMDPGFVGERYVKHGPGGNSVWRALMFPKKGPLRKRLAGFFRYLLRRREMSRDSFPDGLFLSNEFYTLSVHCGTHMDAPYHYGPLCEGRPAKKIVDIPLEWCFGNGVVLDLSHKGPREAITAADVQEAVKRIGYQLQPMDIVLIRTDSDKLWPRPEYFTAHPGMTEEATRWLAEQGIKVMGTDTNGFDLPFMTMVNTFLDNGDRSALWPAHMYGRRREYLQLERVANLHRLPKPYGFKVACFPISIKEAGAAWARVVAIV